MRTSCHHLPEVGKFWSNHIPMSCWHCPVWCRNCLFCSCATGNNMGVLWDNWAAMLVSWSVYACCSGSGGLLLSNPIVCAWCCVWVCTCCWGGWCGDSDCWCNANCLGSCGPPHDWQSEMFLPRDPPLELLVWQILVKAILCICFINVLRDYFVVDTNFQMCFLNAIDIYIAKKVFEHIEYFSI